MSGAGGDSGPDSAIDTPDSASDAPDGLDSARDAADAASDSVDSATETRDSASETGDCAVAADACETAIECPDDVQVCSDRSRVSRDPDNACEFFPCPAYDPETIVALWNGTDELRVLNSGGALIMAADLPGWIEAMDIADIDEDGDLEIAVGLESAAEQVRLFEVNALSLELEETVVSGVLPSHVEGVAIGDADNDGENEIVAVLELGTASARVRVYDLVGDAWVETLVSTSEGLDAQDVKIADVDEDGENEILVLMADPGASGSRQVRAYRKELVGWSMEEVTPLVSTAPRGAERLVVADADGDGDRENVTAYHSYGGALNFAVTIDWEGDSWVEQVIEADLGNIDAIDVGYFDVDAQPDVIMGEWSTTGRVRKMEFDETSSTWTTSFVSPVIGRCWDVAVGDSDADGANDILVANNETLLRLVSDDPTATEVVDTFEVTIDSVMIADLIP